MAQRYKEGDVGTRFEYVLIDEDGEAIPFDDLAVLYVRYRLPDRTTFDRDLLADEDEEAVGYYAFQEGEMTPAGYWKHEYRAEFEDGRGWTSDHGWFRVWPRIPANEGS